MKRRSLLSLLATGSAGAACAAAWRGSFGAGGDSPVLLLLELRGGNDGLNTLAPHRDPLYRQARPTLALDRAVPLSEGLGLHPALAPLLPLFRKQRLGFALGVGWPEPNRSHFRAADQWATANPEGTGIGWIASLWEDRPGAGPLVALDPAGCRAMEGGAALALQLSQAQLRGGSRPRLDPAAGGSSPILRRLLALEQASQRELDRLRERLAPLPPDLRLPRGGLGQQVGLALRLLGSSACPPVLQLAQGGYDTHAAQAGAHNRRLVELAEALVVLDAGLRQLRRRPRVTLLAVSEFGRRLQENGSRGTDHGSASLALLYGDHVQQPLLGSYPSLERLDPRGDLIPALSPVDLYRHVLIAAER